MGFLHDGHLSLIELLRSEGAEFIVVSIFVNPTQFGPNEDLESYPRDEARDIEQLESHGVDLLFAPAVEEIYPPGAATSIVIYGAAIPLEGERRPGHFNGVATVVLKLVNMVQPDLAAFGRKDAQQCAVVSQLVRDLALPVRLLFGTTVRESDGLAMSSRNAYLSPDERGESLALYRALEAGRRAIEEGESDPVVVEQKMKYELAKSPAVQLDYLRLVDPATFEAPAPAAAELLLVGAVRVGRTRLIDNLQVRGLVTAT
jgi:pantoate--beta-alanine ligase